MFSLTVIGPTTPADRRSAGTRTSPDATAFVGDERCSLTPFFMDGAFGGMDQSREGFHGQTLAGILNTNQGRHLARSDAKAQTLETRRRQVVDFQGNRSRRSSVSSNSEFPFVARSLERRPSSPSRSTVSPFEGRNLPAVPQHGYDVSDAQYFV